MLKKTPTLLQESWESRNDGPRWCFDTVKDQKFHTYSSRFSLDFSWIKVMLPPIWENSVPTLTHQKLFRLLVNKVNAILIDEDEETALLTNIGCQPCGVEFSLVEGGEPRERGYAESHGHLFNMEWSSRPNHNLQDLSHINSLLAFDPIQNLLVCIFHVGRE